MARNHLNVARSTCLVLAWLAAFAAPARAADEAPAPRRLAVQPLEFTGEVPEEARRTFSRRLEEGLTSGGFVRTGDTNAADFVVRGRVAEQAKTYDIELEIADKDANVLARSRERCEICGQEEAAEKVAFAAGGLRDRLDALARTPARVLLRAHPTTAVVSVDGRPVGQTPLEVPLAPGRHTVVFTASGFDPLERTVTAVAGVEESLDVKLVPLPTKFPYRGAGYAALVTGAAMIAAGIYAFVLDGDEIACAASEKDLYGNCPRVRDTGKLGIALTGVGAAVLTLGGTWLYLAPYGGPGGLHTDKVARFGLAVSGRF